MAWRQQDYILRMIEQVGAALRRALQSRVEGDSEAALNELRTAAGELLGPAAPLAAQMDAESAVNIIGDAQRLGLWARLLAEEAATHEASGDRAAAAVIRQRALHIARAAAAKDEGVRDDVSELIRELDAGAS